MIEAEGKASEEKLMYCTHLGIRLHFAYLTYEKQTNLTVTMFPLISNIKAQRMN